MRFSFESDNPKLLRQLEDLKESVEPSATAAALNKTATTVNAKTRRDVSRETGIAQKLIKKRIAVARQDRATARKPWTVLWVGLYPIRVSLLTPKPRFVKSRGALKYKTLPGQPVRPDAFAAKGKKGVSAFHRKQADRLPIKEITVNIAPILQRRMWMNLGAPGKKRFAQVMAQELDFRVLKSLRKYGLEVQ